MNQGPDDSAREDERVISNNNDAESIGRVRRTHWKTKLGCLECKRRHLKCDETRPVCKRCESRNASCVYSSAHQSMRLLLERQRPSGAIFSMTLSSTAEDLDRVLSLPDKIPSSVSKENLEGLRRFETFTSYTLGGPDACDAVRTEVMRLAFTSPILMNAIMGTAITHFCHLVPSHRPAIRAEYYWNRAISLYRKALLEPVDPGDANILISACMMLAVHSFSVYDRTEGGSWVFSSDAMPSWLYVQGGLPTVREICNERGTGSIWSPVFDESEAFRVAHVESEKIEPAFAEVCGIDEKDPNVENNPYYVPLQTLSALHKIDASSRNLSKLVVFVGCMQGEYRRLVSMRDPCALLILGHWFAIMANVEQWWLQSRAKFECHAICAYLERKSGHDPRMLKLLGSLTVSCGYESRDQELQLQSTRFLTR